MNLTITNMQKFIPKVFFFLGSGGVVYKYLELWKES